MMNTNSLNIRIKRKLSGNTKAILKEIIFPFRNRFLLFNVTKLAQKNQVNLNYWLESDNLGDTISPLIVNHMLSHKGLNPKKYVAETKHLYAVGSVLTAGIQDCTVWGSGVLNASLTYRLKNRKLDIRSVRGPFTRAILIDYGYVVPEVYGDPAIILPEIYKPVIAEKKAKFGLVLHMDYPIPNDIPPNFLFINIRTTDYKKFIEELNSVEVVISSSLHGIIIAEAYGIRAVLLKPKVDILKYYDWYLSTNRIEFPIAETIEDAMKTEPTHIPDLERLREGVKEAFPYDIYS